MNMQIALAWLPRIAKMLGEPEMALDPRFSDPKEASKPENAEVFEAMLIGWLGEHTMVEAWSKAQAARVLSGPIYTVKELLEDPHLEARGAFERIGHREAGVWRYPGLPFRTEGTPLRPRRPAPRLGEHTDAVLLEAGLNAAEIARLRASEVIG